MDFRSTNFGELLFAINCDSLKNEIIKLRRRLTNVLFKLTMVFILIIYRYKYISDLIHLTDFFFPNLT